MPDLGTTLVLGKIWNCLRKEIKKVWTKNETSVWTLAIMQGLDNCREFLGEGNSSTIFRKGINGEYILDFTLTTWPNKIGKLSDLPAEGIPHYSIVLAAESEMGKYGSTKENFERVMEDFCKLIDIKAKYKVMLYGLHQSLNDTAEYNLEAAFGRILNHHEWIDLSKESWLFVGLPWKYGKYDDSLNLSIKHGHTKVLYASIQAGTIFLQDLPSS
ncbi:MAG: hypothetical protein C4523_15695 [Myxococcales bacterium]|nr:MAG: hypothetical protein C4523_15695 [Myxococcales bacterium]